VVRQLWSGGEGPEHSVIMLSSQDQGQPTYSGMMPLCFVTKLAPEAVLEAATLFLQMLSFLATFGSSAYKHGY